MVTDCLPNNHCCGGYKSDAMYYIRDVGIPNEKCLPYIDGYSCSCNSGICGNGLYTCNYNTSTECSDRRCASRCRSFGNKRVMVSKVGYVPASRTNIKTKMVNVGPLAVSLNMDGGWDGDIFRCEDDVSTNHAIVLVGYNDAGGYWIAKNSWGASWDTDGYFKVGYGECAIENWVYYAKQTGFNSSFNGTKKGWEVHKGTWVLNPTNYQTTGVKKYFSSIGYNGQYYPLSYTVRMKRKGCSGCANGLIIRGKGTRLYPDGVWDEGYFFEYLNKGYISVWKIKGWSENQLKGWTKKSVVNKGGWNTLKVVAQGSTLKFYVNGTKVWQGTDSTFKSGRVGITMFRNKSSTGNKLKVDWATLTIPGYSSIPDEDALVEMGGEELPGGSHEVLP